MLVCIVIGMMSRVRIGSVVSVGVMCSVMLFSRVILIYEFVSRNMMFSLGVVGIVCIVILF